MMKLGGVNCRLDVSLLCGQPARCFPYFSFRNLYPSAATIVPIIVAAIDPKSGIWDGVRIGFGMTSESVRFFLYVLVDGKHFSARSSPTPLRLASASQITWPPYRPPYGVMPFCLCLRNTSTVAAIDPKSGIWDGVRIR